MAVVTTNAPLPQLTRWGLTPDADLLFRALTMRGPRNVPALARDLGIAPARVEAALSALRDAGAAAPTVHFGGTDRRWAAADIRQVITALAPRRRPARPVPPPDVVNLGEDVHHLRSREATRARLAQLAAVTRHSHLTINPEVTFEAASLQAAAPLDRLLQARGVQIRVLGVTSGDPDLLCPYGGQPKQTLLTYRQAESVPMKLIVIDRKVALFPVDPHEPGRGYLEVSQQPIVDSLTSSFERHWAAAHDPSESAMPKFELSPREEAVITLLVLGNTDAGVARELRISERSVSSIVRSIMDRLGVENRFQLGVALGTLSAAPPPPGLPFTRKPEKDPNP